MLGGSVGNDVPGTFSFAALAGNSGHRGPRDGELRVGRRNRHLTATGPRGALFTVQVTDPATGAYTVTLVDEVSCRRSDDEATDAIVSLGYVVTDADGSTAPGTLPSPSTTMVRRRH